MRSLIRNNRTVTAVFGFRLCVALLCGVSVGVAQEKTAVLTTTDVARAATQAALQKLGEGEIGAALTVMATAADLEPAWRLETPQPSSIAAGGLHRALSQLSSEEQFDLLSKWTLPTESRRSLRVWIAQVPTVTPPAEFARVLGERPRPASFPIASVGGVRGLFSTAALLVHAAKDSGKLGRLIKDLEPLAADKVPHADALLWLARLSDERVDDADLMGLLDQRINGLRDRRTVAAATPAPVTAPVATIDPSDVLIAAAALDRPSLRERSETLFELLLDETANRVATSVRPFLQRGYATALLRHRATTSPEEMVSSRLPHWVPVNSNDSRNGDAAVWINHEDYLLHLTGSGNDVLLFRYPLTGDFRFECETQAGGAIPTDGGLVYGGFSLFPHQVPSETTVWDSHGIVCMRRPNHYLRIAPRPTFNRHAVVQRDGTTRFQMNGHTLWEQANTDASPWLGLRTLGDRRPLFRHLKFSGNPVIPREVALLAGEQALGWQARTWGEPQPEWFTITLLKPQPAVGDWTVSAGELRAGARSDDDHSVLRQSLLNYQRPLLDGESVSYDFHHQPGVQEVHPAIGRVVFLLQSDGVRLHWVTDGAQDWTTLPADNAIVEPLQRRGPKRLPLKEGDWNRVQLSRQGNEFTLSLNDTVIYQRTLDEAADHRFGFYRNSARFGVQIRKVVLTGDWPQEFPEELRASSTQIADVVRNDADRQALNELFQDVNFCDDVTAVRQQAAALSPPARLEYLTHWILPGPNHAGFRTAGDFTTVDPLIENAAEDVATEDRGGHVVSPVFDWLEVARELNALPALRERVLQTPIPADSYQQRARMAVLALLCLELDDKPAATKALAKLLELVQQYTAVGIEDQWPESLVIFRAVPRFPQFEPVDDLLSYVYGQRTLRWLPANSQVWHTHLAKLAMAHRRTLEAAKTPMAAVAAPLPDWFPGCNVRSVSRGLGYAPAEWEWRDHTVTKISGHEQDFLFYRYPLAGDYSIECELSNPVQFRVQVLQAGVSVGARPSLTEFEYGAFAQPTEGRKIEPKLGNHPPWTRYRAVVKEGQITVSLNGRTVLTEPVKADAAPWVGLRAWGQLLGSARDFRISGNPAIPDAVHLATSEDLPGWYSYNVDIGIGTPSWALWKYVPDPQDETSHWILGREFPLGRGSSFENTLFYARPLAEGERIDYEFYYQPGEVESHPVIDRTAFLLTPDGIREHWITDGRYDRTGTDPANSRASPEFRRGDGRLPLKADAWNRCQIAFHNSRVQMRLNDQLVYERPVNPCRQPSFGLFYFTDLNELRVRNIVLRGDWPKSLPSISEQSLAHSRVDEIDADRSHMTASFEHDFVKDGLPAPYFQVPVPKPDATVTARPDGVAIFRQTTGTWGAVELNPRVSMAGDFDVELTFDDLQTPSDKDSGLQLSVQLDNERQVQYRNIRTRTSAGTQELYLSLSLLTADNSRVYPTIDHSTCEATSGRLRLSRRGSLMHFLFAEQDSPYYRMLHTEPASDEPVDASGVKIIGIANGVGSASVVVKHLLIRAERILWHPEMTPAGPRGLFVMKPDGTGLKQIASPPSIGFAVVGSAEFSRDGKKIAMDMSQGSTATSHLIVCNADGTGIKDIGTGCMPSFSPDGKQIICSHAGIEIMNADGTNRRTLDGSGWGTQWSPDGKWIAYGKSGNIVLMNPQTLATRTLLTGGDAQHYTYIYWNLGWSHDSKTVGFKARRRSDGEDEVAVIDIDKPQGLQPLLSKIKGINPDITFTANNDGVVFGMHNPKVKGSQLHVVYRKQPDTVHVLPNQPENVRIIDAHWSRDGRWLAFSGQELAAPTEWTTELARKKSQPQ